MSSESEELVAGPTITPAPDRQRVPSTFSGFLSMCVDDVLNGGETVHEATVDALAEGPDLVSFGVEEYHQRERYVSRGMQRRCSAPHCRCESPCDTYCDGRWR